ncbi:MAG TPA: hypothetical protein VH702_15705 [Vicinamibacterales bacterium]|jgi:hypothetical protein
MMIRAGVTGLVTLTAIAALQVAAAAQFGHPLKGSWSGDWGPSKEKRTRVLLELHWDGKEVTGTINPGPNAVPLKRATLDVATWMVRFEADSKDASGKVVPYVIDGKLENLGAYYRFITGTWTQGGVKGDFRITRN